MHESRQTSHLPNHPEEPHPAKQSPTVPTLPPVPPPDAIELEGIREDGKQERERERKATSKKTGKERKAKPTPSASRTSSGDSHHVVRSATSSPAVSLASLRYNSAAKKSRKNVCPICLGTRGGDTTSWKGSCRCFAEEGRYGLPGDTRMMYDGY
jgi:hypothetical protein